MKNIKLELELKILEEINDNLRNKITSKDNINKIIDNMISSSQDSEKTRELAELKEFLKSKPEPEVVVAFENLKLLESNKNLKKRLLESKPEPESVVAILLVKNTFLEFVITQPPTITRAKSAPDILNLQVCANNTYPR